MKGLIKRLLREGLDKVKLAYSKIDELPEFEYQWRLKRISKIFKISKHTNNELPRDETGVVLPMEENVMDIDIMDIHISQLFVDAEKVKGIIDSIDKAPIINICQFSDGVNVCFDGHHRLVAYWALGEKRIKVNKFTVPEYHYPLIKDNKKDGLLREGLLDEEAMRYDKLSEGTGLFIKPNNSGAELVLFNPSIDKVYGTITFISNVKNGPYHYVSGVAAEKGFGPFIYELAMMWCNQNGSMLMPSRDGSIEKEAWVVWSRFYDRNDIIKNTLDLYDSDFKFDMVYPDEEPMVDYEREEMWNDSNSKDKKTLLIFNTSYSIKPNNDYNVLIKKANEYPEKIYDKAFKLGDKFFTYKLFNI